MVRRKENDLIFKIGITVHPVLVSQKFMEQVVVSKKYSRQALTQESMVNPSYDLLYTYHVGRYTSRHFRSPIPYRKKELGN